MTDTRTQTQFLLVKHIPRPMEVWGPFESRAAARRFQLEVLGDTIKRIEAAGRMISFTTVPLREVEKQWQELPLTTYMLAVRVGEESSLWQTSDPIGKLAEEFGLVQTRYGQGLQSIMHPHKVVVDIDFWPWEVLARAGSDNSVRLWAALQALVNTRVREISTTKATTLERRQNDGSLER